MKITANQYAETLLAITKDKKQAEIDIIIAKFIAVVKKNRQEKMFAKIISTFNALWNKKYSVVEANVNSREELDAETMEKIKAYVSGKYEAKEVVIKNIIDQKLIGGIVVRVGDEIFDGSILGQLKNLKKALIR